MLKTFIKQIIIKIVSVYSLAIIYYFKTLNTILGKKKLLVFTDSRGHEVTSIWNKCNPNSSYVRELIKRYSCDVHICPEKHTSLLDFLEYYESSDRNYDAVILHCGIVDFAPRPESSFLEMYSCKKQLINKYNLSHFISLDNRNSENKYNDEYTYSFLNEHALKQIISTHISKVDNLIYIGVNKVLCSWRGQYWRDRPSNINEQLKLDRFMLDCVVQSVNLSDMGDDNIKLYTSDNVHYTREGFDYIYQKLNAYLPE